MLLTGTILTPAACLTKRPKQDLKIQILPALCNLWVLAVTPALCDKVHSEIPALLILTDFSPSAARDDLCHKPKVSKSPQSSLLLRLEALPEHSYGGGRGAPKGRYLGPREMLKLQNSNQVCNKDMFSSNMDLGPDHFGSV